MRLIHCHIENFGKLSDFSVDFEEHLTVFCRENGWGKSTLAAFLRVMFFGFEGEAKRKGIENERKRYQPWQGGVYGGQILFETGGKRYFLSRVFADKKQNDVFELRDAETNLESDDFSDNLGEEIFRMNSESFQRSVFIGQNDCATHATDGINAKMGNLADTQNDLDCYEKASALLAEEQNRLNPRRKTGEIYRRREELTALETEAAAGETLAEALAQCETLLAEERTSLEEKRAERERLAGLAARVSRAQDQKAKRTIYAQLAAECEEKEAAYRQARSAFPGKVPGEEDLQSCLNACDALAQARQMKRTYEVDESQKASGKEPDRAQSDSFNRKGSPTPLIIGMAGVIIGAVLLIFGADTSRFAAIVAGMVCLALGLQFCIVSLIKLWTKKKADAALVQSENERRDREEQERRENYELWQQKYDVERQFLSHALDEMGISLPGDLAGQEQSESLSFEEAGDLSGENLKKELQELWKKRILLAQAERDWQAAKTKQQEFAEQNSFGEASDCGMESLRDIPTLEVLNGCMAALDDETAAIRGRIRTYEQQLSALQEKYDAWTETKERLETKRSELSDLKREYRLKQKAAQYLTQAKETLTARYMEPLMHSFSHYYQLILKEDAGQYRMDANANVTVEEQGMQREPAYLSTGYQDLIGLCTRLAFVEAMYQGERPFLILDDVFVNLDDEKLAGAQSLLRDAAARYQVIYFTCSDGRGFHSI